MLLCLEALPGNCVVDINEKKLAGEVLDLNHGISFVPQVHLHAGTYEDCENSNIVIITAGVGRTGNQDNLLKRNRCFQANHT